MGSENRLRRSAQPTRVTRSRHVYSDRREARLAPSARRLTSVIDSTTGTTWQEASEAFLRRDLSPGTRRVYALTLAAIGEQMHPVPLAALHPRQVAEAVE